MVFIQNTRLKRSEVEQSEKMKKAGVTMRNEERGSSRHGVFMDYEFVSYRRILSDMQASEASGDDLTGLHLSLQ